MRHAETKKELNSTFLRLRFSYCSCPNQEERNPLHFQPHPSMQHQQQLRQQRFFGDEMLMTDFQHMDAIEKRFYVPPEFREQRQRQVLLAATDSFR